MRNTIKKHSDFIHDADAPKFITEFFILKVRATRFPGDARYGITATKRTFKHATDRNRAKRKLRAWLRTCENAIPVNATSRDPMSPDLDYVFIARSAILDAKLPDGVELMKKALRKLGK
ncbi:MAG: ribonuclease P protein component [Alphaproteobacteria bacterium]|nr:ribonuclease P protein component [Alphaproteobacteria bacterium]